MDPMGYTNDIPICSPWYHHFETYIHDYPWDSWSSQQKTLSKNLRGFGGFPHHVQRRSGGPHGFAAGPVGPRHVAQVLGELAEGCRGSDDAELAAGGARDQGFKGRHLAQGGKPDRGDMKTQIGTYEILLGGFNHLETY